MAVASPQRARGVGAVVRGVVGKVCWGYYTAAAVHGFTVSRNAEGQWRLTGSVVMTDRFKLAQRPLWFAAPYVKRGARAEWRWPIEACDIQNSQITATLGPLLE